MNGRPRLGIALVVALAALAGCAARGPVGGGRAVDVARTARAELRQLEALDRRGRADGDAVSRMGYLRYVLANDRAGEAEALARALEQAPDDPAVRWRHARAAARDHRLDALLAHAAELLRLDPDGVGTALAWRLVAANRDEIDGLWPLVDGWLADERPRSAVPAIDDLLATLCQDRLAQRGDRPAALARFAERGYLTRWTAVGPRGDDPARDFTALTPADPTAADARPRTTVTPYLRLADESGGGVVDAWTTVDVVDPGRYLLTAAASGSLRLAVDGVSLIEADLWSSYGARQYHATVELTAGAHDVFARVATDGTPATLSVRLRRLGDVTGAAPRGGLSVAPGDAADRLATRATGGDLEARLDLALARALEGAPFTGRAETEALAAWLPDSAEVRRRAGLAVLADGALADGPRRRDGITHLRAALRADPELSGVGLRLARLQRISDPEGTRELVAAIAAHHPDRVEAWLWLLDRYADLGWDAEAEIALGEALARAPRRPEVLDEAAAYLETRGRTAEAHALRQRQLDAVGTPLDGRRAALLEQLGRLDEADAELAALIELDDDAQSLWQDRVRLARARGDAGAADELLEAAVGRFPDAVWPHRERAALALAGDDPARTLAHLDAALTVDPGDFELRARRWRLAGDVDRWRSGDPDAADAAGDRDGARAQAHIAAYLDDPGGAVEQAAVTLFDRREIEVFAGGASLFRLHRLVHLQSPAAVEAYAEVTPGDLEVLVARTWRTDGRAVDADPPAEKDSYSLRDLTPGCSVEILAIGANPADLAGEHGGYVGPPVTLAASEDYVRHAELLYLLPAGAEVTLRGTAPPPERHTLDDGRLRLRWTIDEQPPRIPEPLEPTAHEVTPWVQLFVDADLDRTLARDRAIARAMTRPSPSIEARADALAVPGDPQATARAVIAEVRATIRPPSSGAEAAAEAIDVWAAGAGSHEHAALAVLRAAGVAVDRVRVRPRVLPPLGDQPRIGTDYPFTLLRVPGRRGQPPLWIDLADPYLPVGWLHPMVRDAELVALDAAHADLPARTPATSGRLPGLDATLTLEVDDDGDARGTLRLAFFRQSDGLLRETLWSVPDADRRQTFEGWLAQALPGATVTAVEPGSLDDPDGPAVLTLTLDAPGLFAGRGGALEAPALLSDLLPPLDPQVPTLAAMVLGGDRSAPLLVWPYHERLTVTLSGAGVDGRTLSGWTPVTVRTPQIDVTREARRERRAVVLTRETTMRLGRIPAEAYPGVRDLIAAVVSSGRQPMRLQPE